MTAPQPPRQLTRLPTWPTRLEALLAQRQTQPFAWGLNDCCTFAADCVQAITGQDPAPAALRHHRTQKQAARALKRHGGMVGMAVAALGQPVPSSQACVGDVVLCTSANRPMLAICNGTTALAPSSTGLVTVPLGALCWRVG